MGEHFSQDRNVDNRSRYICTLHMWDLYLNLLPVWHARPDARLPCGPSVAVLSQHPPPSLGDQNFSPLLRRVLRLRDLVTSSCFWSSSRDHLPGWPADQPVDSEQELSAFSSFLQPLMEGRHLCRFWPCYWRPPAEVSSPGFLAHRPVSPHLGVPVFPCHGHGLREKSP